MRCDGNKIKANETAKTFLKCLEVVANMPNNEQRNIARAITKLHPYFHYGLVRFIQYVLLCESEDYKSNSPYNENKLTALKRCNTIVETIMESDEKERANSNDHTCTRYLLSDLREEEIELPMFYAV